MRLQQISPIETNSKSFVEAGQMLRAYANSSQRQRLNLPGGRCSIDSWSFPIHGFPGQMTYLIRGSQPTVTVNGSGARTGAFTASGLLDAVSSKPAGTAPGHAPSINRLGHRDF